MFINNYFFFFQDKVKFLTSLSGKGSQNNLLLLKDLKVQFCKKNEMCIGASEYSLPVIYNDFPVNFDREDYYQVSSLFSSMTTINLLTMMSVISMKKYIFVDNNLSFNIFQL